MNKQSRIAFAVIIVLALLFIIIYGINKDNKKMQTINNIVSKVKSATKNTMLYVGSSDCEACQSQATQMSLLLSNYDFNYYYVDYNEITTTSDKTTFVNNLGIDISSSEFSLPQILIYKNGKVVNQFTGLTSINKIFDTLKESGIISSKESLPVNYLTYSSYKNLLEQSGKQVVMIGDVGTTDSNSAQALIWTIAKENNVKINYLMVNDLSETELTSFKNSLDFYSKDGNTVTSPTMLIIEDGKVIKSLVDLQSSDSYVEFLKENDIIE